MLCIFCNKEKATTNDHVVSKQLYPKPWPSDFKTVPSCLTCNKSFQKDEDYFRIAITSSFDVIENSKAAKNVLLGPVMRSFERNPVLTSVITKDMKMFPISSEDGQSIFFVPSYSIDKERISNVVNKIIRGLFYIEKGKPLLTNCEVLINLDINDQVWQCFSKQPKKEIGKGQGVFEYQFFNVEKNEFLTSWLICFYKRFYIFAVTISPEFKANIYGN